MSGQHTSGPWSYTRNPENTRWIIDSAPNHGIACTAGYECDNEANARLMAAAPDTLKALQSALGHLLNAAIDLETGCTKKATIATLNGGIAIARAAIRKANGAAS